MKKWTQQEIIEKLKKIIQLTMKDQIDMDKVNEDTDLLLEYGIDSINGIEILVRIEGEFDIEIDDEDLSAQLVKNLKVTSAYILDKIEND